MSQSTPGKKNNGSWKQFMAFFRHARLSWGWIILAVIANMVYYATVTSLPGSTAALFAGKFTTKAIMGVVINYGSVMVAMMTVSFLMLIAEAKSVLAVRRVIWKRMMGIETRYYDQHSAGQLFSAVTSDTEIAVGTLMRTLVMIPGLLTYLGKALPQINGFSPKLLWAVLVLIPVYILYAWLMGRWQFKVGLRIQMRIGGLTGYLTERIRHLTMIKSFVTEKQEEEKGVSISGELYKANIEYSHLNSVIVVYTLFAEVIGIIIAVLWGCQLLRTGEISLQSWLAFFLFVPTINTVFRQLASMWATLKDVQGRAARLGELMEAPQECLHAESAADIPKGDIAFENVSFAYREDSPVLNEISFTIPAGKTTAIVGPFGSGKTTVLRLLERLYTPENGKITLGGAELNEMNLQAWRANISYVNQDAELFSGTVREALTYGLTRKVDDEELKDAARTAGILDFIYQSPLGFDTELALWGSTMSGGQRQRMVIARELLKRADILLLDEPTSALDPENAAAISNTFFRGFKGKTIVAVTHELNYIAQADQIIVLNEGRVAGCGTHEQLMDRCPVYRALVEEQSYQEVFAK